MTVTIEELPFDAEAVALANEQWGCNCGPAALAAVTGLTLDTVRPHLGQFEEKQYTNPTMMAKALRSLQATWSRLYECPAAERAVDPTYPHRGLVRIQWAGPWTEPGRPVAARYRHTHWIAVRHFRGRHDVFDVNAMEAGGWISWDNWRDSLVPWLLPQVEPKANGQWWPTHCWAVDRIDQAGRYVPPKLRARLEVANKVLAMFASDTRIESRQKGWAVTWTSEIGSRISKQWACRGNDFYPVWNHKWARGGTASIALSQLVRWLRRLPVLPLASWRHWASDKCGLVDPKAVELLRAGGYPEQVNCVLCHQPITGPLDWWHLNDVSGPCCGRAPECRQKGGGR